MDTLSRMGVSAAATLGLSIIIAASIGAYTFYAVRTLGNTLSVTGSATQAVKADTAKWTVTVRRSATEDSLSSAQVRVSTDSQAVVKFFDDAGIPEDKITTTPIFVDQDYSKNNNSGGPTYYTAHEDITVDSNDPALIQKLSKDINALISKGIFLSSQPPAYYVSSLPQIRVTLIGQAITDAKARAESIAKSTGQRVGALQSASGGVVQVLAPNSGDVSDYGSYDTSTIDKQVMVTARAVFQIR